MGGILLVLLLAPVLWAIMWSVARLSYRLSKSSPWRLAAGIFFVATTFGLIALQFHLLAIFETDSFARSHSLYVIFPDIVPGIALGLYKGLQEERVKKKMDSALSEFSINREHIGLPASASKPLGNGAQRIEIAISTNGILRAVIFPGQNKPKYILMILVTAICSVNLLGLQFVLIHPISRLLMTPTFIDLMRLIQTVNVLAGGYVLALAFTGKSTLTLDLKSLKIESSLLNLTVSKKSFANSNVMNLRYAQWQTESQSGTIERSGIRFEVGSKTHTFGTSVTTNQAHELLNRMRSIYSFPMPKEAQG